MKKSNSKNCFIKESKRIFILLLSSIVFFIIQNSALADNYTEIPQRVIKFANKHHCTNIKPYFETKEKQRWNKEYDVYDATFEHNSRNFNCIILLKNNKRVRFANVSESLSFFMNVPISKFEGTHPIKEWFFIHIFIH